MADPGTVTLLSMLAAPVAKKIGGGLLGALGMGGDWYYQERQADLARERERNDYELALKRLGLQKESLEDVKKQRQFSRLMDLTSTGPKLMDRQTGVARLQSLRTAGS